jgi:hypothetical protein
MAEYVMGPDDKQDEVARDLMDHVGPERAHEVVWYPRPGVPGGGVFSMPDDLADGYTSQRVSRLDDDARGEQIRLATDGTTAEPGDPTEFNDALARGEAPVAASPATGPNPVAHLVTGDSEGVEQPTTSRSRRAQAKAQTKAADTTKE